MKIDLTDALVILLLMIVLFCCYSAYEVRRLKDQTYELKGGYEYLDEQFELEIKK